MLKSLSCMQLQKQEVYKKYIRTGSAAFFASEAAILNILFYPVKGKNHGIRQQDRVLENNAWPVPNRKAWHRYQKAV